MIPLVEIDITASIISLFVGYLCGSIPFGLVLTKLFADTDIRAIGSGNIGATNVLRTGNRVLAFATLFLDAGKGTVAILIMAEFFSVENAVLSGAGAVLGHCFPVWLKFSGGKGVATSMAVVATLSWQAGLLMAISWLLVARITGYSSLAALLSFVTAGLFALTLPPVTACGILSISVLSWARHYKNIKRLLSGTESKISLSRPKF